VANGATMMNGGTRLNLMPTKVLDMKIIAVYIQATDCTSLAELLALW